MQENFLQFHKNLKIDLNVERLDRPNKSKQDGLRQLDRLVTATSDLISPEF